MSLSTPKRSTSSLPRSRRFDLLDGVRGLAALAVMLHHYTLHNGLHWIKGAWVSVDLYFVLSGFVIAHSYSQKIIDGLSFSRFCYVRFVRLAPLYSVGLLLGLIAAVHLFATGQSGEINISHIAKAFALNLVWLPYFNYLKWPMGEAFIPGPTFPINDPAWSLFFELFVNLAYFAFVFRTRKISSILLTTLALFAFWSSTIYFRQANAGWRADFFSIGFARVIGEFFLGALIYQYRLGLNWLNRPALLFGSVVFACFFSAETPVAIINSFFLIPAAITGLATVAVDGNLQSLCTELGELSYPLYIIHFPIYRLAFQFLPMSRLRPIPQILVLSTLAIASAWALSQLDRRVRRLLLKP